MKQIPIPVVAYGPGSQSSEEEDLQYAALPKMETFAMPEVPAVEDAQHMASAAELVERIIAALESRRPATPPRIHLALDGLAAEAVNLVNEVLGQGEVSIILRADSSGAEAERVRIQESAFAGLWRVQQFDSAGRLESDAIEIADIPQIVRATLARETSRALSRQTLAEGLMNAPSVLSELAHQSNAYDSASRSHVINLTLLPMTPQDLSAIDDALGRGPVTILSRGFGNCRIGSTRISNVWRVQYFNSMETLILNLIEVTDVPAVALAAAEDIEDTLERLRELLAWMREQ